MKKTLALTATLVAFAAMASTATATAVDCSPVIGPALLADTVDATNTVGPLSYTCGGLTFSNFLATDAGNVPLGTQLFLDGATYDASTGIVLLGFNPNLANLTLVQDMHLQFMVTGGVNQIDLNVGGNNSTVNERVCTVGLIAEGCAQGGTLLATISAGSTTGNVISSSFTTSSPIFIFKDINKGLGGELTQFTQSFHTAVPEPMTLSMMGIGLLGLGLVRRRQQGRK